MALPSTPSLSNVFTAAQQSYINDQCFLLEKAPAIYKRVTEVLTKRGSNKKSAADPTDPYVRMPGEPHDPSASPFPLQKGGPRIRQIFDGSNAAYGYTNPRGNTWTDWELLMRPENGRGGYSNIDYINKITQSDKVKFKNLFNLTPDLITKMAHYVDVSEALTRKDSSGKDASSKDSIFKDRSRINGGIFNPASAQTGAGILDISVVHEGIDSATKNIVLVDVKYVFQDIREMLNDNYSRLFSIDTKKEKDGKTWIRTIEFEIGWNNQSGTDIPPLKLITNLVSYTFDLEQNGSISVNAKYRGHVAQIFSGPSANILEVAKKRFDLYSKKIADLEKIVKQNTRTSLQELKKQTAKKFLLGELQNDLLHFLSTASFTGTSIKTSAGVELTRSLTAHNRVPIIDTFFVNSKIAFPGGGDDTEFLTNKGYNDLKIGIIGSTRVKESVLDAMRESIKKHAETFFMGGLSKGIYIQKAELEGYLNEIEKQIDIIEGNIKTLNENIDKAIVLAQAQILNQATYQQYLALQSIVQTLLKKQDVYYAVIDKQTIIDFKIGVASGNPSQVKTILSAIDPGALLHDQKTYEIFYGVGDPAQNRLDEESQQVVPYIFFGHLLENILQLPTDIKKQSSNNQIEFDYKETVLKLMLENGGNFHIDLGLLSYKTPFTGEDFINLPIYFLPISLKELNNFFVRKILAENRSVYSVHDFIFDILKKFWGGAFNSCGKESFAQTYSPSKLATTYGNHPESKKSADVPYNQYFIHSQKSIIEDLKSLGVDETKFGKWKQNLDRFIPHFFLFGSASGIDMSVKIRDIADPLLKQAVYYRSRSSAADESTPGVSDPKTGLIPSVFQAEVETIGMPFFNVGQLIYVDLEPFINETTEASRPFKASGYYAITKVTHSFSKDKFTTKIEAIIELARANRADLKKKPKTIQASKASKTAQKVASAAKAKKDKFNKKVEKYEKTITNKPGGGPLKDHFDKRSKAKPGAGILPGIAK